jgi:large subunit ribosomal protein L22
MATTPEQATREVRAVAKWVRMSPRKARLVTDHIRGRSVPEARTVLAFTPRAAAREIEKVLRSAVANAEANHGLVGDELIVSAAYVDEGPMMKRWRARARGRVARIRKPTCHITVKLAAAEPGVRPSGRVEAPVRSEAALSPAPVEATEPTVEDSEASAESSEATEPGPEESEAPAAPESPTDEAAQAAAAEEDEDAEEAKGGSEEPRASSES